MATASLNDIRFVRGKLVANPTSLTTVHGGTELGLTRGRLFRPNIKTHELTHEAFGGETSEVWHMQKSPLFLCFLRTWDADAVSRFFPEAASSVVTLGNSVRSGLKLSGNSFKFLFLADDSTNANSILIYKFVPIIDPEAVLGLSLKEEFGLLVGGVGIRHASGLAQVGPLASLTLGA